MDKIELTTKSKRILLALSKNEELEYKDSDENDYLLLEQEGLINLDWTFDGPLPDITNKGKAYVHVNPELKNPSIWDDKKYLITTGISLVAFFLSLYVAIFK